MFPAMHLTRGESATFPKETRLAAPSDDPEELTMVARRVLRQKYLQADVGITGANFAIAETGMISITENEGNARLTAALPKIHDHARRHRKSFAATGGPRLVPAHAGD